MMPLLLDHFTTLPFEARKDAAMIFSNMAKHNTAGACVRACVRRGWCMDRIALPRMHLNPQSRPHNHTPGFADPYIAEEHFSIITQLIAGYGHPEVALNCGQMIREAIRHETVRACVRGLCVGI